MEKTMEEHRSEHNVRDAEKSFQASQSAATNTYKTNIDLLRKGMERGIEVQKNALELASQQNADTVDLWRAMFRGLPGAEPMFNWAEQSVENLIGMRRRYLDIVSGQGEEMSESAKTQGERTKQAAHEITPSSQTA
jgi:hypothetical protein